MEHRNLTIKNDSINGKDKAYARQVNLDGLPLTGIIKEYPDLPKVARKIEIVVDYDDFVHVHITHPDGSNSLYLVGQCNIDMELLPTPQEVN